MTAQAINERVRVDELHRRVDETEKATREALRLANESLLRLGGHESQCDLRYGQIAGTLQKIEDGQDRIHERIDETHSRINDLGGWGVKILLSVSGGSLLIIAYLLLHGRPWANL